MINIKDIETIVLDSLYSTEEVERMVEKPPADAVFGDGIVEQFAFHPERIKKHREKAIEMLKQLDNNFMKTKGGGWTFLNMPMDKDGTQWGEQRDAGLLCAIGMALGLVQFPMPRDMWEALPGGVPYVIVRDDLFEESTDETS